MRAILCSLGIVTTGTTMVEHNYYVSAYRILYSDDGQRWTVYREPGVEQDKVRWLPQFYFKNGPLLKAQELFCVVLKLAIIWPLLFSGYFRFVSY